MSTNAKAKPVVHAGTSILMSPRFSPGLLLRDDDLNQGVDYTRDLSRLLFRTLLGCGVVCGLKVTSEFKCEQARRHGRRRRRAGLPRRSHPCPDDAADPDRRQLRAADPGRDVGDHQAHGKMLCPAPASCSCDDEETPAVCTGSGTATRSASFRNRRTAPADATRTRKPWSSSRRRRRLRRREGRAAKKKTAKKAEAECQDGGCPSSAAASTLRWTATRTTRPGACSCDCADCLRVDRARLSEGGQARSETRLEVDHSVRRFVRPLLMCDPVAREEHAPDKDK